MAILSNIKRIARYLISGVVVKLSPTHWKEFNELRYWRQRKNSEGGLSHTHYKHFYTDHFSLDDSFYKNKIILDIGCGPQGSLEWASMTLRRIGLDPLAGKYLRLGANHHQMEYVCAPSEHIPIKDFECDVVASFNSLDHVENIESPISEIKRVTRIGGLFLLLVEVNHPPTYCEPHKLTPKKLIGVLTPEFSCESVEVYTTSAQGMYESIRVGKRIPNPEETKEIGYMSARFVRTEFT